MSAKVPMVDIDVTEADVEAVLDCLRSGWLTMGPRTQALEQALAEQLGVKHAVAVASGTAALHLACRAAGLDSGTEAIVPALTFVAVAHAPRYCGADAVLCDSIGSADPTLDPAAVERLIRPQTKVVIGVHLWGYPAAVERLRMLCDEHGLTLIEDCAEAILARVPDGRSAGSVGHLGCFSFRADGQLPIGEGGLVATDDEDLAASVRTLRSHAMSSVTWERHRGHGLGYDVTDVGYNYRIDEPRAALALSRLERLDEEVEARRRLASVYRERLTGVDGIELPFDDDAVGQSSHFAFPVLVEREVRDGVVVELAKAGIESAVYPALHRFSQYACAGSDAELPIASEVGDRGLCLPLDGRLDAARIERVGDHLVTAVRRQG